MTITGYSDRINHALAFAAKHHDRQVHKGTRAPYGTHAANVAVILTRYDCDAAASAGSGAAAGPPAAISTPARTIARSGARRRETRVRSFLSRLG